MNAIRRQFFLSYAVIGSVAPLMTVFLREQGEFNWMQVGMAISLMNIPMLFSPAFLTLLADRNLDPRRILAVAAACSATVLTLLFFSTSTAFTLVLFVFHGLAFFAMLPLQDGYFFSLEEEMRKKGEVVLDYPLVRVWGTVGFILPSLILFVPLARGASASSILPVAVGFCILSVVNSLSLAPVERVLMKGKKLPTRAALSAIFSPEARWLSIGLFFGFMAATSYYAFIGNYLVEVIGIQKRYVGLIINFGVALEIGYTLLMPWMQARIQLKGIMVAGLACMVIRMLLLAFFPYPVTAILAQLCHGIEVLAIFVGPVIFVNRLASDEFRNSIQGVFTMAVGGTARVIGGIAAGFVVTRFGLQGNFIWGASLGLISFLIITFLFRRIPPPEERSESEFPVSEIAGK